MLIVFDIDNNQERESIVLLQQHTVRQHGSNLLKLRVVSAVHDKHQSVDFIRMPADNGVLPQSVARFEGIAFRAPNLSH